jgi:hypothetical protein
MRWVTRNLMAIMAVFVIAISLNAASAMVDNVSDLKKLISVNEDTRMNSEDLAFFLATHNYRAVPRNDYVDIDLDGKICKLVPNGDMPGLCDIAF